jgi:hypothetical protein
VPFSFAFAAVVGEDHQVTSAEEKTSWFAVRCLFEWSGPGSMKRRVYEERITLWRAADFDEAIERAETEADEYVLADGDPGDGPTRYLSLAQAYCLGDEPLGDGTEVFSMLRESNKPPRKYLNSYFDTGRENNRAEV